MGYIKVISYNPFTNLLDTNFQRDIQVRGTNHRTPTGKMIIRPDLKNPIIRVTSPNTNMDTQNDGPWKRWLLLNMAIFGIYVKNFREWSLFLEIGDFLKFHGIFEISTLSREWFGFDLKLFDALSGFFENSPKTLAPKHQNLVGHNRFAHSTLPETNIT